MCRLQHEGYVDAWAMVRLVRDQSCGNRQVERESKELDCAILSVRKGGTSSVSQKTRSSATPLSCIFYYFVDVVPH